MTIDKQLEFTTLHGGLLSLDFLQELVASKRVPDGPALSGEMFGLAPSEQLNNYIAGQYTRLRELWQLAQQAPEAAQPTLYASLRDALLDALGFKERQLLPTPEDPSIQQPSGLLAQHDVVLWSLHTPQDVKRPLDEARPYGLTSSPHSMLQTFLNHEETFLWGILCDGHRLRLLRDHYSMTRQAFIEWDLDAIFEQSNPYDFEALMLVAHVTSLARLHPEDPARIEQWRQAAQKTGSRALEALEGCVRAAIEHLGAGLVRHVKNSDLHKALREGSLSTQQLHHALLRLIYRLIFLLVAESRDVLLPRDADPLARKIYEEEYAISALIPRAHRLRGSPHADLWARITKIFAWLDEGQPALALPALGSSLWHPEFIIEPVRSAYIGNDDVLAALRALCFRFDEQTQQLQRVNWRAIGAEELGSVYESLLAYHPVLNTVDREFHLKTAHGNDRKTSGAYYTPSSLVELLLKSALDPVIQRTLDAHAEPEARADALLRLTICDPACGSGHFLVAAAHRLARHVAQAQSGESEPPPSVYQHALREVIARCIHGVDINPMAVELCKVSLWMESMEPGKPLAFLDAHIQLGNSLLGVTPALLKNPIPADAWSQLEGDDKERVKLVAKRHKQEVSKDAHASATPSSATPKKGGKGGKPANKAPLLLEVYAEEQAAQTGSVYARAVLDAMRNHLDAARQVLVKLADDTRQAIGEVEQGWRSYLAGEVYLRNKQVADTWCAAFVWPLATDEDVALAPTHDRWRELIEPDKRPKPGTPEAARLDAMLARVAELAKEFRFFHWHLAFPHVFGLPSEDTPSGRSGGFDVVLGNPPWEKVKLAEKEFFAERDARIANAANKAEREKLIKLLPTERPMLWRDFQNALRRAQGESHLLRNSGVYPLCGRGDVNTYAVFSELILNLTGPTGRSGFIVPSGIATDDTTKLYFQHITQQRALATLYDFENKGLFEKVDSRFKFSLLTLVAPGAGPREIELAFFLHDPAELEREGDDSPVIHLTADDIARINPNTNTCPIFRSRRDANITREVYSRVPVLIEEATETRPEKNPWGVSFSTMFHMSNDSHLFHTREQLEGDGWTLQGNRFVRGSDVMLPLYEAKMIHHYTHRWATYEGVVGGGEGDEALSTRDLSPDELRDPSALPRPRYWVASSEVDARLEGKWDKQWLIGWRAICRSTDERTVIASVMPLAAVGHSLPLAFVGKDLPHASLIACSTSYVFDFFARFKVGGTNLSFFITKQLPVLPPQTFEERRAWTGDKSLTEWIKPRVVELTYTAWDMEPFAQDCGDHGAPFVWDEERRFKLRAELDAAMFHLYGIQRDDVDYIMSTFPIVEQRDRKASATEDSPEGRYLTRDAILAVYDRMAAGEVIAYEEGARHAMR
jgi:type I restriction-modification system DNA methylase subunit